MSEQELDEIVQITVEDFGHDDHTGRITVAKYDSLLLFCVLISTIM